MNPVKSTWVSVHSSELGLPTPSPASEYGSLAPDPRGEEPHWLAEEGVGELNSDDWTDTPILYVIKSLYHESHSAPYTVTSPEALFRQPDRMTQS